MTSTGSQSSVTQLNESVQVVLSQRVHCPALFTHEEAAVPGNLQYCSQNKDDLEEFPHLAERPPELGDLPPFPPSLDGTSLRKAVREGASHGGAILVGGCQRGAILEGCFQRGAVLEGGSNRRVYLYHSTVLACPRVLLCSPPLPCPVFWQAPLPSSKAQ